MAGLGRKGLRWSSADEARQKSTHSWKDQAKGRRSTAKVKREEDLGEQERRTGSAAWQADEGGKRRLSFDLSPF